MCVCPSCVIPQSSTTLRLVCSMCAAKTLLQQNSHTSPPLASSNLFSLPLKLVSLCLSLRLPSFPCLNHVFHLPVLLLSLAHSHFLTHSCTHSSVFHPLPSLSFSLPRNQSHMLEREAGSSEDGQDCVVCSECGTVLEPAVRIYEWYSGTHACICV